MSGPTYPYDDTAQAPSNLVVAERHVVTEVNAQAYRLIIPAYAPFYLQNFKLVHVNGVGDRATLIEDVDYFPVMMYLGAMYGTGKAVYGGIVLVNEYASGRIEVDYQCVGGLWACDPNMVRQALIEGNYNPRVVGWDQVTNVQTTFPPLDHGHLLDDMTRITDVMEGLAALTEAIASGASVSELNARFLAWTSLRNPSGLTLADLGVDAADFKEAASDQEVVSMNPVDKFISLKQMIQLFQFPEADLTALNQHIAATGNVHGLIPADLGLEKVENLPVVPDAELDGPGQRAYIIHEQLKTVLSRYDEAKPHATAASLYFSQP